jgi:hypothetical protein
MILPNSLAALEVRQVILTAISPAGEDLALVVYADDTWGITCAGQPVRQYRSSSSNPAGGPDADLMHLFLSMAGLPIGSGPARHC